MNLPADPLAAARSLAVALGIGLLIGLERERRKGDGSGRSAAGIRTFTLASLAGALCLLVGVPGAFLVGGLFIAGGALLAYTRARGQDPGLTTEVALVVTFLLGGLATTRPALASGIGVIVTVLLAARGWLHRFVNQALTAQEVHDGLIFAAAALVILPLTPDAGFGPMGAIRPRTVWKLVVVVMAVGGAGYAAVRVLGAKRGLPLSGFASGFVSSAATIASMGARAKQDPAMCGPAVAGAVFSTVATVVQLAIVLGATNPGVLRATTWPIAFSGAAAILYGALVALRNRKAAPAGEAAAPKGRAFELKTAILYALTLTAILTASAGLTLWLGPDRGLPLAASVAGFADAHAAAISVASVVAASHAAAETAVVPVLAGFTTNTITKIVLASSSGSRRFALQTIPGLLLVVAAAWAGMLLPRP